MITEKEALSSLKNQLHEIEGLRRSHSRSAKHTKWVTDTLYILQEIFGQNSTIYQTFALLRWDVHVLGAVSLSMTCAGLMRYWKAFDIKVILKI